MLCDGRFVCGCADPYGHRVLGDARASSVRDVWTGPVITGLRQDLNGGGSKFCTDCPLKLPLKKDQAPPVRPLDAGPIPHRMFIECTAACNISCTDACCAPETGITRTRQAGMLDFELFRKVIDEVGPSLGRIDFFNYGEAFLHKRAIDMCEYIKEKFPHIYLYTSTNGLAFGEEQIRRLVRSGIDEVTFSIDGATPESYAIYRRRGNFDKAIDNLRHAVDEKRSTGRDVPFLNWRYILFTHNDSESEMHRARSMAAEIGVDRLCWELTDHPENMYSRRFTSGSADLAAIQREVWDDSNLGNAIPGAMPRARIDVRQAGLPGRISALSSNLPMLARASRPVQIRAKVRNLSTRAFPARASYGRRLVRLGAQLCDRDRSVINRDFERAWLPDTLQPGQSVDVSMTITAPGRPGRYELKFDLVSEGIDWFEAGGSATTMKPLLVL